MGVDSHSAIFPPPLRKPPPQTACAIGPYTMVTQRPENTSQVPNRARSAMAPEIRATVMMAKVAW